MILSVFLGDDRVGEITVVRDNVEFRLLEAYRGRYPRPVLGQVFEDDPEHVHRSRMKLPPFFSNLLPEGALRTLLANQIGVQAEREPYLLAYLGEDLPGAVRVTSDDDSDDSPADAVQEPSEETSDALKFSLAGVQLKLSAIRGPDKGLTIPAHGRGGDWIVKLPGTRFPQVPENEWAMMTLARESGLRVANVDLVPMSKLEGLPRDIDVPRSSNALAVERFDRDPRAGRIHIEDFAQVLNVRPSYRDKYRSANFETIGRIIGRVSPDDAGEFVRRLVFNIAIGNGDAHIKNWSFRYEDPTRAQLAPAYDLVSTIQYMPEDDMGLNLAGSKSFTKVSLSDFSRLATKSDINVDAVEIAKSTVLRIRAAWKAIRGELPISEAAKRLIEAHWERVALLNEVG